MSSNLSSLNGRIARIVAGAVIAGLGVNTRADQLQNAASGGANNQLGPFNNLTGAGVTVGVIEAAGGLANTSSGVAGSAGPNNNLPNGNPDLPSTNVKLFQINGGALPAGGVAAATAPGGGALAAGLKISNHATEVTGVIVGQGKAANGGMDLGMAPGSLVQEGGIAGSDQDPNNGVPALVQKEISTFSPSAINMSFGAVQLAEASGAANNQIALLTYTVNGAGKINGYSTQLYTFANPSNALPALPAGTSYALNSAGGFIQVYSTNGGALVPNNNGNSYMSQLVDWEAYQNPKTLMVTAGNENNSPLPVPVGVPNTFNNGVLLNAALPTANGTFAAPATNASNGGIIGGAAVSPGSLYNIAPADTYNALTIAATGGYTGANFNYDFLSNYNSSDTTSDRRIGVDLVAPGGDPAGNEGTAGANIAAGLAFASNFQTTAGGVVSAGGSDTYNGVEPGYVDPTTKSSYAAGIQPQSSAGTSFATPVVTGADALLTQYAKANLGADALDDRVMKAILMNGASKMNIDGTALMTAAPGSPGARTWQAAPATSNFGAIPAFLATLPSYKNGVATGVPAGAYPVQSGLDPLLGTGQLDVVQSLTNLAAGEQHAGNVNPIGWDFNTIPTNTPGIPNQTVYKYNFTLTGGVGFQATLDWDSPVTISGGGATWTSNTTFTRGSLQDLDLYLVSTNGLGGPVTQDLDYSTSLIDNSQYVYDPTMSAGTYQLDVVVQGLSTQATPYGLAWSTVPEPTSLSLLIFPMLLLRRRRASA